MGAESIPKTKKLIEFAIFFKCFGIATSYLIILRDVLPAFMEKLFGERIFTEKKGALFIFLSLITPFTLFRRITKLKYTSLCGLIAIAFVVAGSIYRLAMAEITIEENTFY